MRPSLSTRLLVAAAGLALALGAAKAGLDVPPDTSNFQTHAEAAAARVVLPGTYQVATLPAASGNQGKYAFVTDLGGGADMVLSDGANWKHIRQGVLGTVAGGGTIMLTPLISPPIMVITGTGIANTNVVIQQQNLYPGATFRIILPGTLAALATLGIGVQSVAGTLPHVGSTWQDVQWNGTALVKIAGGPM